jgi:NADH:ubiquinone oxidoreductase subunit 6 (subunit J)
MKTHKKDKFSISLKNRERVKLFVIFVFHIFGAAILFLGLVYANLIGDLGLDGIFRLWQLLGSYVLPTTILVLSFFVVLLPNPIHALICLILVFFSTALFLLSINVNFLAMIYLIIYIGAIAILFLFVIMMFNLRELQQQSTKINDYSFLSISFGLCFTFVYLFYGFVADAVVTYVEYDKYFTNFTKTKSESLRYFLTYQHTDTLLFGTLLYDYYSYLFLLAGLILLTSMLGSIILALSTTEETMD